MSRLGLSLVQARLHWRSPDDNRAHLQELVESCSGPVDLFMLPETFTTGFLGDEGDAERMDGQTVAWMQELASAHGAAVTGSAVIEDSGRYNRLLWVAQDGSVEHYDKRHLFGHGGEDQRYDPGTARKVFQWRGWRICPQICYDIRFPVWCRNRDDYDLLLVVANWPAPRITAWRSLLQARAIENQCYVAAVNRVGEDGNGKRYPGNSVVFDPLGEVVLELGDEETVGAAELDLEYLQRCRRKLPFQRDADGFELTR